MSGSYNTTEKGKKLENEIAEIYQHLEGVRNVIPNISIMGIQIDIYVEIESSDGVASRYAIDSKNYDNPVGTEEIRKCGLGP